MAGEVLRQADEIMALALTWAREVRSSTFSHPAATDANDALRAAVEQLEAKKNAYRTGYEKATKRAERAEQDNKLTRALLEEKTLTNQQLNEALERAEQEAAALRKALERIVGMCGDVDRCACGRPTGIPAIVMCANSALGEKND